LKKAQRDETDVARGLAVARREFFVDDTIGQHVPVDWWRCQASGKRSVRIADEILKSVVFIGRLTAPGPEFVTDDQLPEIDKIIHWGGTGFFVTLAPPGNPLVFTYLVTAKHVADAIEGNGETVLRLNHQGGGPAFFKVPAHARWWRHPETPESVDVALLPWSPPTDIVDLRLLRTDEWFLTDEIIEKRNIGPGDNVFAVGLFTLAKGQRRNIPIVRTGHIAMMSKERIPDIRIGDWRGDAEVYLVEAWSIGGLSGSPIFVRGTVNLTLKANDGSGELAMHGLGHPYLFGLVHGHWLIRPETLNDVQIKPIGDRAAANLGIAVIVPTHKIMEVINHPELVKARDEKTAEWMESGGSVPDAPSEPEPD
jgi:hypothetical protein